MRYRKKALVIEAVQWTGQKLEDLPEWARRSVRGTYKDNALHVGTLEGVMEAGHGDWLIRGIKGEVYPCKPDIFAESYEAVEAEGLKALQVESERRYVTLGKHWNWAKVEDSSPDDFDWYLVQILRVGEGYYAIWQRSALKEVGYQAGEDRL